MEDMQARRDEETRSPADFVAGRQFGGSFAGLSAFSFDRPDQAIVGTSFHLIKVQGTSNKLGAISDLLPFAAGTCPLS